MDGQFLPSCQTSGRMYIVQYRCFNYDVKSVTQPDTLPLLGNNYRFQMTETGLAEQFKPLTGRGMHRFFWKFQREELKARQSNYTKFNPPLFSLVSTFNWVFFDVRKFRFFLWVADNMQTCYGELWLPASFMAGSHCCWLAESQFN